MATKTKKPKAELKAVPQQEAPDTKRVVVTKDVRVKLTPAKRLEKAKEASALQKQLDVDKDLLTEKTREFKEFKKPQDLKIKDGAEKISVILRELETNECTSKEEVGVLFDYNSLEVRTYFPANSHREEDIIERRTMDAKEQQLSLIPEEAEAIAKGLPEEGQEAKE